MKDDGNQLSEESPVRLIDQDWPCLANRADEEAKLRYPEGPFGLDLSDAIRRSAFISGAAWLADSLRK